LIRTAPKAPGPKTARTAGRIFKTGNERHVHDDDVRPFGEIGGREIAGILFDEDDARVPADRPVELARVHVHREDLLRPALEQAIREPAGRSPDIGRDLPRRIDPERVEGLGELRPAAADEGKLVLERELPVEAQKLAGLVDALPVRENEPGHDQALGSFPRLRETLLDQQLVGPFLLHR
jgi:hypothetical protein